MLDIDRELQRHLDNQVPLPSGSGLPDFDAMVILQAASEAPGLRKSVLVGVVASQMQVKESASLVYYRHIDSLMSMGHMVRNDFRFYVTPTGVEFLRLLVDRNRQALRTLAFRLR